MKIITKSILALSLLSILPLASVSADGTPPVARRQGEVNHRLRRQHRRINQGVKSGELTKPEARSLRQNDRNIHQEERDMRANNGGKLTPADKKALNQQENQNSKEIYQEKHDGETR